ncbi:MAG: DUF3604 domain-containing protein [Phycisphaerales bacterium]|nr:MAG: DUF3604 domain-containing protein [Phycisphaerales bacterium]
MGRGWLVLSTVAVIAVVVCEGGTTTGGTAGHQTVETRIGRLEFNGGYPTKGTIDKAYDQLDVQRATQAYLEFMPMLSVNSIFEAHIRDYGMTKTGDVGVYVEPGKGKAEGRTQERLYDVAVSDARKIGKDGRCKTPVGNTVDVKKATWKNTIGEPDLIAVWKDPDFDPDEKAFYYARVIEIPTPRWTAFDLIRLDADMPKDVNMITQEGVYTSPIWYTP